MVRLSLVAIGLLANIGCSFFLNEEGDGGSANVDASTVDGSSDVDANNGELVDDGLLTRYFIDEADMGAGTGILIDSSDEPIALMVLGGGALMYSTTEGNRGQVGESVA